MHDDIVPELLERIKKDFNKQLQKSKIISDLKHRLQTKEATYIDVNSYAIEVGNILSTVISKYVTEDVLPDGRMYYNIANRLLNDVLPNNHELITGYGSNVQKLLNDKAKLSFVPQVPELNQDKIDGLVNRLSHEKEFRKIKSLLGDPIVTFSQGIVDDIIEKNVDFHYKAGLRPQIIRKESGNCCDWCRALVGKFDYPDVPRDVYRRHGNCRCTVEYDPKSGKVKEVWSKKWRNKDKNSRIKRDVVSKLEGEFVNAKTIEEANSFAEKLGFKADYTGIDIKCANEWNHGLFNAKSGFPEVADRIKFVGSSQVRNKLMREVVTEYYREELLAQGFPSSVVDEYSKKNARKLIPPVSKNNMASSITTEGLQGLPKDLREKLEPFVGITMNDKYFNNYGKVIEKGLAQVKVGWHPHGCYNTKATFDHEFAHQIDDFLGVSNSDTIRNEFDKRTRAELTQGLSEYAWNNSNKSRYSEMIAEGWSEYCNNPNPREIASVIGKEIEKLWHQQLKK